MRNKNLFFTKLERVEGKLKALDMMVTRQGTTMNDIHSTTSDIRDIMDDLRTMVEQLPSS
jgi:hypothetical protein